MGLSLKFNEFEKIQTPDVYMVSQDRKQKVPIQIHNLRVKLRDLEISEVDFDIYEDESVIRDLYPWKKYEGTTWEELVGLTWLDISRSKDYSLFESLRIIYIPDLGSKAYFQLTTPIEIQEEKKSYKTCTARSLENQLTQKDVSYFIINMGTVGSNDGVVLYDKNNPDKSLLDLALKNVPNWSVGEVDTSITFKSRSFEVDKSDIYSFLMNDVAEAYRCIFLFDTVNCKVNTIAVENYGKDTDIHISSRNLAKRIRVESPENSIFTRFCVEGKDGLDIRDVNLGSDYIEDYSYYNAPEWLGSQELCAKYDEYKALREVQRLAYTNKQKDNIAMLNQYHELMNRVPSNYDSMDWTEYGLIELNTMRDSYQNVVDSQIEKGHNSPSHINHDAYIINKQALDDIKAEITVRESEINTIQSSIDDIALELKQIVDVVDKNKFFTENELEIFSSLEVNTDYSDESYVVTESMPNELVFQIKEELYDSAIKEIYKLSHPQHSFKTELLNLFNIPEFKPIKAGFDLGSFITLSMRETYHARLRLIAIDIDFNDLDNLTVEFSNMTRSRDGFDDYMALVKNAISGTSASITRNLNTSLIGVQEGLNTIESIARKGVSYEYLFANYASVGTLEAVNAKIYNLETTYLTAEQAAILFLTAEQADIKFAQIGELNANVADINTLLAGNITADNIKVGTITAESGIIADAAITRAHIGVGVIDSALIEDGAIGTVQIADGSITDGKIVELTANKITSGTIDAANIEVINLRAANITVGTINGNQISSGAIDVEHLINGSITEDKLSTDLNTKLEQNRIDVSTALQEVSDLENSFTILETDTKDKIDKTVKSTNVEYYLSSSSSQPIDGTWQAVAPEWSSDKFMWSRTKITLTDGTISYTPNANGTNISGAKGQDGVIGSDGIGVESIVAQYYHSTSQTSLAGDDWSTIPPTWQQGRYIWTRSLISYTDGNSKTTDSICVSGDQGDRGDKGDSGVSITEVDVQYYLSTSSTSLTEGSWSTTAPTWVDGRFMWSKTVTTYSSGNPTESKPVCITGSKGSTGEKGSDGKGITSTVVTYQNHTNGSTAPTGTWSDTIPAVIKGRYLWTRTITTYTDNSTIPTYSVSYYATDGTDGNHGSDGKGIVSTDIHYQLSTSGTTAPTGTWLPNPPSPIKGQYLWTRTVISYTTGSPSTSYSTSYYATDGQKGDKGDTGASGADAITILLSNESHTFAGNVSNALAGSTVVSIIAYKGTTRVASTIGTITGHVNGLSTSITDNGKTSNAFTVSATTALKTANGVLTIPITVDGKSFTKNFSFAVSFKGATGSTGSTGNTGASGADAKVITLTASAQIFTKPKTGAVTPSTITVTGTTQNTTIATWQYSTNGGAFTTTLPAGVTRSGNVVTINGTTMNVKTIAVKAFNGAIQDIVTIAKVEDGVDGAKGSTGATGKGVTSITEEYAISTSKTTAPADASFSTTRPTWTTGSYIWTRSKIVYNNPTSTAYTAKVVSSEWEAVNDIEVGGRNLILDSAFNSPPPKFLNGVVSVDNNEVTVVQNSTAHYGFAVRFSKNLTQGDKYILSLEIKTTDATPFDFISLRSGVSATTQGKPNGGNYSLGNIDTSGEYKKYTISISPNGSVSNGIGIATNNRGTSFSVRNLKLEKGDKATDWTPAPEDVQAEIDEAKQNAATAQSTADGKNTVIYSSSQPSTSGRKTGDIWFNTSDSNRMYRFTGSTWSSAQFGVNAIANLAITNAKIADGTIQNAKIGNLDAGKITTGTINANRIGALSIVAGKLAVGSVTTDKIGANQITSVKIATDAIVARNIKAGAITVDKIAANAITADKIHSSAITADKIVASAITTDKIAANAITANKILANAITADKIDVTNLSSISADIGEITAGTITGVDIFGSTLTLGGANDTNGILTVYDSSNNIITQLDSTGISTSNLNFKFGNDFGFEQGYFSIGKTGIQITYGSEKRGGSTGYYFDWYDTFLYTTGELHLVHKLKTSPTGGSNDYWNIMSTKTITLKHDGLFFESDMGEPDITISSADGILIGNHPVIWFGSYETL